ncbi:uncharacterized protein A4U43_C03F17680 [Asparagus officinalis]|uniref:Uncharacterized protein n=1 Tax=Asparagus officinalis TaxID=4686 RepID=A0A5P1FCN5_ASPOF|nr:uncharacterized protein A4U43_C03F17680 [Asparagus officinalis]
MLGRLQRCLVLYLSTFLEGNGHVEDYVSKLMVVKGIAFTISGHGYIAVFDTVSGDNGDELAEFTYELPFEDIRLMIPSTEKVLLVDHRCCLHILDLKRCEGQYRPEVYLPLTNTILMSKKNMFLGLRGREVQAWDSERSIMTGFADHLVVDYRFIYQMVKFESNVAVLAGGDGVGDLLPVGLLEVVAAEVEVALAPGVDEGGGGAVAPAVARVRVWVRGGVLDGEGYGQGQGLGRGMGVGGGGDGDGGGGLGIVGVGVWV